MDLGDYLNPDVLKELASAFGDAAGGAVRVRAPDGRLLAGPAGEDDDGEAVKVRLRRRQVGTVAVTGRRGGRKGERARLAELMGTVLARLCEQAGQLHERVDELAAVYLLTEEFTGRTDLSEVHQLVAETMVKVTGADACSIRVFNENRTELLRVATAGLSGQYVAKGPILLSDSVIDREIAETGQCVYIADERRDERVLYKVEAREEGIVSALCAPMGYKGRIEGIIRVYTRRRHEFGRFETSLIRAVAAQAAAAIVNARLYNEAVSAERIRRQLRLAAEVQRRMIPSRAPRVAGLDISAIYEPCHEVGGDFYDFIELADGNLGVCVADVAGKGIPASLLMASARSSLRAHAAYLYDLSEVVAAVNVDLWAQSDEGDFATMFYGVLDVPNRRLTYCSAGHEPALLVRGGQVRPLAAQSGIVGMTAEMTYSHEVVQLAPGDLLVVYTDGLPEAINFRDDAFGRERIHRAVLDAAGRGESAEGVGKHLLWENRRFAGLQTRGDDLTLVTIRIQ